MKWSVERETTHDERGAYFYRSGSWVYTRTGWWIVWPSVRVLSLLQRVLVVAVSLNRYDTRGPSCWNRWLCWNTPLVEFVVADVWHVLVPGWRDNVLADYRGYRFLFFFYLRKQISPTCPVAWKDKSTVCMKVKSPIQAILCAFMDLILATFHSKHEPHFVKGRNPNLSFLWLVIPKSGRVFLFYNTPPDSVKGIPISLIFPLYFFAQPEGVMRTWQKFQPIVISSIRTKAEVDGLVGGVRHCPFFFRWESTWWGLRKQLFSTAQKPQFVRGKGLTRSSLTSAILIVSYWHVLYLSRRDSSLKLI